MTARTVARRYAGALFDVAKKNRTLDVVEQQLDAFGRMLDSHAELRRVLGTPAVPAPKKRALMDALLAKAPEITGEVRQLLKMLAERDRLANLQEISAAFAARLRKERGVLQAEVVTAVPLPAAQQASLAAALRRATGSELAMTQRVDPSIIGGVVARVGSVVYDGSVTRQLERMKQQLLAEQ